MEVRPGYRQTDIGVIPGDWHLVPFSELFELQNGVNADKSAYGTGTPFINVLEVIVQSHLHAFDIPGRVSLPRRVLSPYFVRPGDVLFNRTSETQEEVGLAAVYVDDEEVVFGGFVIRGRQINSADLDTKFSGYALRSMYIRRQVIARGQGAIRANVGQSDLRTVLLPRPPRLEQEAIAKVLSDADAFIESLEQLLAKKRQIKLGAMQELLTGKTRLPGFAIKHGYKQTEAGVIPEDWEVTSVGDEFHIQLGKMLDAEKNIGVPKPFLGNRAIQWGWIDLSDIGVVKLTPSDVQRFRLREGDLLVCEGGEVGRAAIWHQPIGECYYQKALHRLRPKRGYNATLMLNVLQRLSSIGFLLNFVTQTSIAHLPKDKFEMVPIPRPPKVEQEAIAAVLTDMEAELASVEGKLVKARQIKQGMMQELLTGRIRLI